jgi:hypothetical protein
MRALSTFRNLTGGRIPPLTRTALLCGLGIFLLALIVFKPGAGGNAPAQQLVNGVRLVPPGDARTESVVLLDTSAVYFPGKSSIGGVGHSEVGQPEDAPFAKTAPVLQFDPARPLGKDSTLQVPRQSAPAATKAIPLGASEPFTTFGSRGFKGQGIVPRAAFFEVYSMDGAIKPLIFGNISHFGYKKGFNGEFNDNINPFKSLFEVIISVDSFGKAPFGSLVRPSGSPELDEAILGWAKGVDWARQLPPGVYRLIVGP